MINSNIPSSAAGSGIHSIRPAGMQAANQQSVEQSIVPIYGQSGPVTVHPTTRPITHGAVQALHHAPSGHQVRFQFSHASGPAQVSQLQLRIGGNMQAVNVPLHMYAYPPGFAQAAVPAALRQEVPPRLQAMLLRQLQHTQQLTPARSERGQFLGQPIQRLAYRTGPTSAVHLALSAQGTLLAAVLRETHPVSAITEVRFSNDGHFPLAATLSLHDLQWMDRHLPSHVVDHVVHAVFGNPAFETRESNTGHPVTVYRGPINHPHGTAEPWILELHFHWNNGRFALAAVGRQEPGETSLQTITQSWAMRQQARSSTALTSVTQASTSSSLVPLARSRSDSLSSQGSATGRQDKRARVLASSPEPTGPLNTVNTDTANAAAIADNGYMTQDAYRQLLPPHLRHAMVCPPIAMGTALGFTVPFSVVQNRFPQAVDGMTLPEVVHTLVTDYGVRIAAGIDLGSGLNRSTVISRLTGLFGQPNFDAGVVQYQFYDPMTQRSGAHFVSFETLPNGNLRLSDSRTDEHHDVEAIGRRNTGIAYHLAGLYARGRQGQDGLSIRAFRRSQIPNVQAHRQAAQAFLQGAATTTTTTTTTSTIPGSPATVTVPTTLGRGMRQALGVAQSEQARDQAFQAFAGALALPPGWAPADLADAHIELIHGTDLDQNTRIAWQRQYPEQSRSELDATPFYLITPARPELGQTLIDAAPTLPSYQAWRRHDDEVQATVASATFLIGVATQPVPTPGSDHHGNGFFGLDLARWTAAQPPGTPPSDVRHAFLLSNLLGELVPASAFAEVAAHETDALTRMELVVPHRYAQGQTRLISFTTREGLRQRMTHPGSDRMVVQYAMMVNGRSQRQHLLLRRNPQGQWERYTPSNVWQRLPGTGSLANYLAGGLWNSRQRDPGVRIRVLEVEARQDNSSTAVAARQRAAYQAIVRRAAPPASPANSAPGSHLTSPAASQASSPARSASATPPQSPRPVSPSPQTMHRSNANLGPILNLNVGESNTDTLARLRTHLESIDYVYVDRAIRLLTEMATGLANQPPGSRTFTELHLRGPGVLHRAMQEFLRGAYPNRRIAVRPNRAPSDIYLGQMNSLERFFRGTSGRGPQRQSLTPYARQALDQLQRLGLAPTRDRRNNILRFEQFAMENLRDGETLQDLHWRRFDQLARRYVRRRYQANLIHLGTQPNRRITSSFMDLTADLARLYHLRREVPAEQLRSARGMRQSGYLHIYRTHEGVSSPPPQ